MADNRFAVRRQNLLPGVGEAKADALLVSNVANVSYLTGFSGDSSLLLLGPKHELIISDTRYETQLADECPGLKTHIRTSKTSLEDTLGDVLGKLGLKTIGFESGSVTVENLEKWSEKLKGITLKPVAGKVEALREVKDEHEVAEIREAIRMAERGFIAARAAWLPEMTELQAAHELEHLMRRFGATKAAFDPIVAAGPRSALPHARPTKERLGTSGFALIDWGAITPRGYRSDLTRVIATGTIPPKLMDMYRVVLQSQQAAFEAMRPGVTCDAVDAVARRVIESAGVGPCFGHGLGHGIGIDIHEGPRLAATSKGELKAGMVITLEPAIYEPGFGGVRIEDDVLVTPDGAEWLSTLRKDWEFAIGQ